MRHITRPLEAMVAVVCLFPGGAEVKVVLDEMTILPYEPATAAISIRNQTGSPLTAVVSRLVSVRVRQETSATWQTYESYGPHATLPVPETRLLAPGETIKDCLLLNVDFEGRHIYSESGVYLIQVGTPYGESEPARLTVKVSPAGEAAALKEIAVKKLYLWFTEDTARACSYLAIYNLEEVLENLQAFVRTYPQSKYAGWCRLGSLWIRKIMVKKNGDTGTGLTASETGALKKVCDELTVLAPTLPSPQNEHGWLGVARTASDLGEGERVEAALGKVEKSRQAGYFKEIAGMVRKRHREK